MTRADSLALAWAGATFVMAALCLPVYGVMLYRKFRAPKSLCTRCQRRTRFDHYDRRSRRWSCDKSTRGAE